MSVKAESKPYNWSEHDLKELRRLAPKTRVRDLVKLFGRSKDSIVGQLQRLKLKSFNPLLWRQDELDVIRNAKPDQRIGHLAKQLGRSYNSVRDKAQKLGVQLRGMKRWTEAQEAELLKLSDTLTEEQISERIGRSVRGVQWKAVELGIVLRKGMKEARGARRQPVRRAAKVAARKSTPAVWVSQLERCPQCECMVSNWQQHFERMGHRRPFFCGVDLASKVDIATGRRA
jgi:hypothetical protein